MKKIYVLLAIVMITMGSCNRYDDINHVQSSDDGVEIPVSTMRSYDEAYEIANDALVLIERDNTRSTKKRVINYNTGQTIMYPETRGAKPHDEPMMYVFNHENNEGFTIVAANRSQQALIAVTE